ncbi:nucleotidyltransferase family protein [uncultured Polaribacter sp.]|uniref:nucleotidyltransferase family protein n=1 Tax=uncultured Polaribacter sp. TaxID=174711 RepID=UPI00259B78C8|nr:nucleotidyltransferase family protein [uncultured Polaribacter sp.]
MNINDIVLKACLSKTKKDFSKWNCDLNKYENLDLLDGRGAKLVPFFLSKLNQYQLDSVHQERLKVIYRYFWLKSNFLEHETKQVCEMLKKISVEPLIFKGMSLAYNYDNIAYRPTSDIDILIPYDKFNPALRLLNKNGYIFPKSYFSLINFFSKWNYNFNSHAFSILHKKKKIELDLHWSISHLLTKKGLDYILLNAVPHPKFKNAKIPILEHEAYISIIHGYYSTHYENWAIDLLMMKNLKNKFNIDELWKIAEIDNKMYVFHAALIKLKKFDIDFRKVTFNFFDKNNLLIKKKSKYSIKQKLYNIKYQFYRIYGCNLSFFERNYIFLQMLIFQIIHKVFYASEINKYFKEYK